MRQLAKFSLSYDPAEDRIAWDGQDTAGAVTRLWITQRLCRDFVGALVPRLPKPAAPVAAEHETAVQSWEQAAAMASFGATPGVAYPAGAAAGLVRTVHINPAPGSVGLVFEASEGDPATITLDAAALRQTLAVLHQLCQAALWPTDYWPAWIADAPKSEHAPALN
jgi:hypothetical protein